MTNKRGKRGEYGPKNDLTGQRFGYLEVIKMGHKPDDKRREYRAICKCHNCGRENYWIFPYRLKKGQKSCGCLPGNMARGKNHYKYSGYEGISGSIWWKIKEAATRRNLEFTITIKDTWELFEAQNRKCALTGLLIEIGEGRKRGTASLDRKDSSKGYVKSNIQWVYRNINIIKYNYSQEYFVNICRRVANNELLKNVSFLSDEEILAHKLFANGNSTFPEK